MGKTVLVTGGTRRLGKAISEALRTRGWRVLTSSHCADAGADFVADFATPGTAKRLYDEVRVTLGGEDLDALVNNAALFDDTPERLEAVNFAAQSLENDLRRRRATPQLSRGGLQEGRRLQTLMPPGAGTRALPPRLLRL